MNSTIMLKALKALNKKIPVKINLLIGGGAAMLLAYQLPLSTDAIDAIIFKSDLSAADLDVYVKEVAYELELSSVWLDDSFNTFLYSLTQDFADRLNTIYEGKRLTALALGAEDLFILKCFAARPKDIPHAKALFKKIKNFKIVESHLELLSQKKIPGAEKALDFLQEIQEAQG